MALNATNSILLLSFNWFRLGDKYYEGEQGRSLLI